MAQDDQHSLMSDDSTSSSSSSKSENFMTCLSPRSMSRSAHSKGYTKSEWISRSVAEAMVMSDFGLSLFECPLDRHQADVVCTQLTDLNCKITAIWVVARPLGFDKDGKFQHWAIKLQAPPSLISLDFLEVKKSGYIRFESTVASNAELKDFLHFYYIDQKRGCRKRRKWKVLASVTPGALHDPHYLQTLDDHEMKSLRKYISQHKKQSRRSQSAMNLKDDARTNFDPLSQGIHCKKRVCDIADFISMWTQSKYNSKNMSIPSPEKDERGYNAIISNCQQFVADLFNFLVGKQYPEKVKKVFDARDIPLAKQKHKRKRNLTERVRALQSDRNKRECSVTYDYSRTKSHYSQYSRSRTAREYTRSSKYEPTVTMTDNEKYDPH
eukprot:CAMPEP_0197027312 /NCGR_PEP_ID=MMETSP1384-20130603/7242_1 /TAXON_ID=29189 /ORGANISM="Ammonia sp." /LENGTH=381 /DNA_ID=CAMNT_0042456141 /DNA_START=22 /DNA_END=1167 /DNA_ORIENTATION=+